MSYDSHCVKWKIVLYGSIWVITEFVSYMGSVCYKEVCVLWECVGYMDVCILYRTLCLNKIKNLGTHSLPIPHSHSSRDSKNVSHMGLKCQKLN